MEATLAVKVDDKSLFNLVTNGDASKLSDTQKLQYYKARCDAAGLDPRTAPFQFIRLQGREILYATKEASNQLASKHGIRLEVVSQITENGIRTVVVRAIAKDGRQTDEIGCVPLDNLKGADLANAFMKAVSKAKRRAVLSLCGLGMMDESEIETVKDLQHIPMPKSEEPEVVAVEPEVLDVEQPSTVSEPVPPLVAEMGKTTFIPTKIDTRTAKNGNPFWVIFHGVERYRTFSKTDSRITNEAIKSESELYVEYEIGKFGKEITLLRYKDPMKQVLSEEAESTEDTDE